MEEVIKVEKDMRRYKGYVGGIKDRVYRKNKNMSPEQLDRKADYIRNIFSKF